MIGQFLINTVLSLTHSEQCVKSVKLTLEKCFIHQFSDSKGWVPKYDCLAPPPRPPSYICINKISPWTKL